jgi:hypothetical protein
LNSVHFQCSGCRRLNRKSLPYQHACEAFPNGIPKAIIFGDHDHTKPYRGDGGKLFEPIPEPADGRQRGEQDGGDQCG